MGKGGKRPPLPRLAISQKTAPNNTGEDEPERKPNGYPSEDIDAVHYCLGFAPGFRTRRATRLCLGRGCWRLHHWGNELRRKSLTEIPSELASCRMPGVEKTTKQRCQDPSSSADRTNRGHEQTPCQKTRAKIQESQRRTGGDARSTVRRLTCKHKP